MILLIVLVNPVFNHEGMTILTYFPWDNPLTLESIVYGIKRLQAHIKNLQQDKQGS